MLASDLNGDGHRTEKRRNPQAGSRTDLPSELENDDTGHKRSDADQTLEQSLHLSREVVADMVRRLLGKTEAESVWVIRTATRSNREANS